MRWRWLIGSFVEPEHREGLDRDTRKAIEAEATEALDQSGALWKWGVFGLAVPALLLIKFALPPALNILGYQGSSWAYAIGIAIVCGLVWVASAIVFGFLYRQPVRRAMRPRGVRVCVECGYDLTAHADTERCPECGATAQVG